MKSLSRIGAMAIAVVAVVAVVTPSLAASDVTVGDFVQRLAAAKNLNATDAHVAVDSLSAVGIRIPGDVRMDARLTEADVVRISRLVGVRVTSSNPDRAFTSDQVDSYFFTFADELAPIAGDRGSGDNHTYTDSPYGEGYGQGNGPGFDPFSKGKGKHKGKAKGWQSATEPE